MSASLARSSAQFISKFSKDVFISLNGIKTIADILEDSFIKKEYSIKRWKEHELHPKTISVSTIEWIFLVDSLNFSFWSEKDGNEYKVSYNGVQYTGYFSLCAAINRAMDAGIPICDASYYVNITIEELENIFKSDTKSPMPLLNERHRILQETGKILLEKYGGSFKNCIQQCENSAEKLLNLVVQNFPSYRDEADFKGQRVAFYKRAQILIGDIWACFEGENYGKFNDIEIITAFADYRVPQTLAFFGALTYSENLLSRLMKNDLFESGEVQEVEIRGCTIWAVDLIFQELHKRAKVNPMLQGVIINSILIDNFLWDYRRDHNDKISKIPFHKIRCIYY